MCLRHFDRFGPAPDVGRRYPIAVKWVVSTHCDYFARHVARTRPWTITPTDLDVYVRVNAAPGATRAALSYQRHNLGPEGIAHNRARAERKLAMPVLAVGAESGAGATLLDTMRLVATDVRGAVFAGCGHYMPEEAPSAVAEQIIRFMGK